MLSGICASSCSRALAVPVDFAAVAVGCCDGKGVRAPCGDSPPPGRSARPTTTSPTTTTAAAANSDGRRTVGRFGEGAAWRAVACEGSSAVVRCGALLALPVVGSGALGPGGVVGGGAI